MSAAVQGLGLYRRLLLYSRSHYYITSLEHSGSGLGALRARLVVLQVPALDHFIEAAGEHVGVPVRHGQPRNLQPARARALSASNPSLQDVQECWPASSTATSQRGPLSALLAQCTRAWGACPTPPDHYLHTLCSHLVPTMLSQRQLPCAGMHTQRAKTHFNLIYAGSHNSNRTSGKKSRIKRVLQRGIKLPPSCSPQTHLYAGD